MAVGDNFSDSLQNIKPRGQFTNANGGQPKPVNQAQGSFTNTHAAQAEMRMTRPQTAPPSFTAKVGSTADYGCTAPVTRQRASRPMGGQPVLMGHQMAVPTDFDQVNAAAHPNAGKETAQKPQHSGSLSEEQFGRHAPQQQPAPQEEPVPQHQGESTSRGGGIPRRMPAPEELDRGHATRRPGVPSHRERPVPLLPGALPLPPWLSSGLRQGDRRES